MTPDRVPKDDKRLFRDRVRSTPGLFGIFMIAAIFLAVAVSFALAPALGIGSNGATVQLYLLVLVAPLGGVALAFLMKVESKYRDFKGITPEDAATGPDLTSQAVFLNGALLLERFRATQQPEVSSSLAKCSAWTLSPCEPCNDIVGGMCNVLTNAFDFSGRAIPGLLLILLAVFWIVIHNRAMRVHVKGDLARVAVSVIPSTLLLSLSVIVWFL